MLSFAASGAWGVGIVLGGLAVVAALACVLAVLYLAFQIASQAHAAKHGLGLVRQQLEGAEGVAHMNDSAARILHATRALRKVAVGE